MVPPPDGGEGCSGVGAGEGGVGEGGGKGEGDAMARSTGSHCDGQVIIFSSRSRPSARRSGCPSEQTAGWRDSELGWPMACATSRSTSVSLLATLGFATRELLLLVVKCRNLSSEARLINPGVRLS